MSVGFVVTGTIPETPGAPRAVGFASGLQAVASFAALLLVGIVVARNRSFVGPWRWLPLGMFVLQFGVFMIADAIGQASGRDVMADGLGLVGTGLLWLLLGHAVATRRSGVA